MNSPSKTACSERFRRPGAIRLMRYPFVMATVDRNLDMSDS